MKDSMLQKRLVGFVKFTGLKKRVIRKWFARFRVENFSVKNTERLGDSRTVVTDKITTLDASDDQRNPKNSWNVARKRCGAPQRCR